MQSGFFEPQEGLPEGFVERLYRRSAIETDAGQYSFSILRYHEEGRDVCYSAAGGQGGFELRKGLEGVKLIEAMWPEEKRVIQKKAK